MTDDRRLLIESAIAYGREHQHVVTGFIHDKTGVVRFFDNWLFVLALLSSRQLELCSDGRILLEKLLGFQTPNGLFPAAMHEYPNCYDRYFSLHLLPVLQSLLSGCRVALGTSLSLRLQGMAEQWTCHYLQEEQYVAAPYHLRLMAACSAIALGGEEEKKEGARRLEALKAEGDNESWLIPSRLGGLFIALRMAVTDLSQSKWQEQVLQAVSLWDPELQTYVGPGLQESYEGGAPTITAFDCMMCLQQGSWGKRFENPSQAHLEAIVFRRWQGIEVATLEQSSGLIEGRRWLTKNLGRIKFSAVEQEASLSPLWKTKIPFRTSWGNGQQLRSFIAQLPHWVSLDFHENGKGIKLIFSMDEEADTEDRDREILFFLNNGLDTEILVSGKASSTFALDDELLINADGVVCRLTFAVTKGEGRFVGHLMPGSRFAERGEVSGVDKQIFLRTLERSTPCKVAVNVCFE